LFEGGGAGEGGVEVVGVEGEEGEEGAGCEVVDGFSAVVGRRFGGCWWGRSCGRGCRFRGGDWLRGRFLGVVGEGALGEGSREGWLVEGEIDEEWESAKGGNRGDHRDVFVGGGHMFMECDG